MHNRIELSKSELVESKDASTLPKFADEAFELMKQHKTEFIGAAVLASVSAGVIGMRALNRLANKASMGAGGIPDGAVPKYGWGEVKDKFVPSSHNPLLAREVGFGGVTTESMKVVPTLNYGKGYEIAFWNGNQWTYGNHSDVLAHELPHKFASTVRTMEASPADRFLPQDIFSTVIERSTNKLETSAGSRELAEKLAGSPPKGVMHIKFLRTSDDGADSVLRGTTNFSERLPNKEHDITFFRNHDDFSPVTKRVFGNFLDKSGLDTAQGLTIWKDALKGLTTRDSLHRFAQATVNSATRMLNPRIGEVGISEAENHALHLQKAWKEVGIDTKLTANR